MESSCWFHSVVCWSSHHRRSYSHCSLQIVHWVIHEMPNPKRTLIVGTQIITSNELDTVSLIVSLLLFVQLAVSPIYWKVIDFCASITYLIFCVEISRRITSMLLDFLAWTKFGFHFSSCYRVKACVTMVKILIMIFCNSNCLQLTGSCLGGTITVYFRKMNWQELVDWVEIIIIYNFWTRSRKFATHDMLSVHTVTRSTMAAGWVRKVD
jgi:hypothetical protein